MRIRDVIIKLLPIVDLFLVPGVAVGGVILKLVRRIGMKRLSLCRETLIKIGVFPIRKHYYEPLFDPKELKYNLSNNRDLKGLDFNVDKQIELVQSFEYKNELLKFNMDDTGDSTKFYYNNASYGLGDAELLYSMIRKFKPKRIIEIGSGNSTLISIEAINKNKEEYSDYYCEHICIEPYEMKWLEKCDVNVIRKKLQDVDKSIFEKLEKNDILFIDSSHVIRPQGDVVEEYLEILPVLNRGVLVHIHDIYTPQDYREELVLEDVRFWNEQYLMEAFLTCNSEYEIVIMAHYLKNNYFKLIAEKFPILAQYPEHDVCAFWIKRK